jgi:hypothetical protein
MQTLRDLDTGVLVDDARQRPLGLRAHDLREAVLEFAARLAQLAWRDPHACTIWRHVLSWRPAISAGFDHAHIQCGRITDE